MSPLTEPTRLVLAKGQPVAVDPFRSFVSLHLKGDGNNGSTTIIDSSPTPKTVTANGNAQTSTAQSRFGGSSIAFDGSGDYLSLSSASSFVLGAGKEPFTVELFFYQNSSGNAAFFTKGGGAPNWNTSTGYETFLFIQAGVLYWMWSDGSAAPVSISTAPPVAQQWHHIAASYDGTTTRLFLNGASVGTPSGFLYSQWASASRVRIGASPVDTGLNELNGYIDELRITRGIARYQSSFTPPTAPFPDL